MPYLTRCRPSKRRRCIPRRDGAAFKRINLRFNDANLSKHKCACS